MVFAQQAKSVSCEGHELLKYKCKWIFKCGNVVVQCIMFLALFDIVSDVDMAFVVFPFPRLNQRLP